MTTKLNIISTIVFISVFTPPTSYGITLKDFEKGAIFDTNKPEYVDEEHVIIQICQPNKRVTFENISIDLEGTPRAQTLIETRKHNMPFSQELDDNRNIDPSSPDQGEKAVVRKWVPGSKADDIEHNELVGEYVDDANHGHTLHSPSLSTAIFPLIGNTIRNQPVYETEWARRPQDALALEVAIYKGNDKNRSNVMLYWFKPPNNIPHNQFSDWQEPLSQETPSERQSSDTDLKLMEEKEITLHPVDYAASPVIRYRIMSVRDYYDSNKFWYRERDAISNQYYRDISDDIREKLGFAPVRPEPIPNCNGGYEDSHPSRL